jgi:hypothetical protein
MVVLLPSDAMKMGNATSHLWMMEWHTPKFQQAVLMQCFFGAMGVRCQSREFATSADLTCGRDLALQLEFVGEDDNTVTLICLWAICPVAET